MQKKVNQDQAATRRNYWPSGNREDILDE